MNLPKCFVSAVSLLALSVAGSVVSAQRQPAKPTPSKAAPAARTEMRSRSTGADEGPNSYRSLGKRDPFRSLETSKTLVQSNEALTPPPAKLRPPGLPGMLVSEVNIIGIAGSKEERLAVIQGRDKVNYLGKVGDKLFNGLIAEIDTDDKGYFVSFLEEVKYPDGKVVRKKTVRRLYAEQSSS